MRTTTTTSWKLCAIIALNQVERKYCGQAQWVTVGRNDVTLNLNGKRNNKRHHCVGVKWVIVRGDTGMWGPRRVTSFQLISSAAAASTASSSAATQSVFTSLPASPWAHRRPSCRPWSPAWGWSPSLWTSCPRALSLCCSCACGWVEFVFVVVAVVLFFTVQLDLLLLLLLWLQVSIDRNESRNKKTLWNFASFLIIFCDFLLQLT